jgi:hypothetical protein
MTSEMTTNDIKRELRDGKYAWPGGYPKYFITSDGAALSFEAVRSEWSNVCSAVRNNRNDGWRVVAVTINWEDGDLICEHTGERIESAYAEPDFGDDEPLHGPARGDREQWPE